jgi:hypothetical protein
VETFFQRVLSAEAERHPSFVVVSITRPAPGEPFSGSPPAAAAAGVEVGEKDTSGYVMDKASASAAAAPPLGGDTGKGKETADCDHPADRPMQGVPPESGFPTEVAWSEVEAALNNAILGYQRSEAEAEEDVRIRGRQRGWGGDSGGGSTSPRSGSVDAQRDLLLPLVGNHAPLSLELVEAGPALDNLLDGSGVGGKRAERGRRGRVKAGGEAGSEGGAHCAAVFRVVAPPEVLTPALDVARALEATQLREAASPASPACPTSGPPLPLPGISSVVPFNRGGRDCYLLTLAADMAALVFVTVFYQVTVNADAEALVETYHQGLFPIDYVLAITACIALIVLDRVVYLNRAKVSQPPNPTPHTPHPTPVHPTPHTRPPRSLVPYTLSPETCSTPTPHTKR